MKYVKKGTDPLTQTGTPLGNNKFKSQIESKLKIKVGYNTRERPRKL